MPTSGERLVPRFLGHREVRGLGERERAVAAWRVGLGADDVVMTCELAVAEVLRAVRRVDGDESVALAHLDALDQVLLDRNLLLAAGRLGPGGLRSLDAIHLAAAQALGDELGGVVTYDERMAVAARDLGLRALAPGRPAAGKAATAECACFDVECAPVSERTCT